MNFREQTMVRAKGRLLKRLCKNLSYFHILLGYSQSSTFILWRRSNSKSQGWAARHRWRRGHSFSELLLCRSYPKTQWLKSKYLLICMIPWTDWEVSGLSWTGCKWCHSHACSQWATYPPGLVHLGAECYAQCKTRLSSIPFGHIPLANESHDHSQFCKMLDTSFSSTTKTLKMRIKSKFISRIIIDVFLPTWLPGHGQPYIPSNEGTGQSYLEKLTSQKTDKWSDITSSPLKGLTEKPRAKTTLILRASFQSTS